MIAACLIARNEGRVLARCLGSVLPFVEECVLLDTGSDDDTVDVAKAFGCRVFVDRTLSDGRGRLLDFSAARNLALSKVRSDWVLSIDADETLAVSDPADLSRNLRRRETTSVEVLVKSGQVRWYVPRLFRRQSGVIWRGRVHEWVDLPGQPARSGAVAITNLPDKIGKEAAAERDLRLCEIQLEENPGDLRATYYLANALRSTRRYEEATEQYRKYIGGSEFRPGVYWSALNASACFLLLGEAARARHFGMKAYRIYPQFAEACCVLGDAWLAGGRADLAAGWFQRALERALPGQEYPYFVDVSSYGDFPRSRLHWMREQLTRVRA